MHFLAAPKSLLLHVTGDSPIIAVIPRDLGGRIVRVCRKNVPLRFETIARRFIDALYGNIF